MTKNDRIDVTLVIPAYNEQECIDECVNEADEVLRKLGRTYEILVIDDGSTDGTLERLRALKAKLAGLRVIRFRQNRGQSAALAAGFDHARGEIVVCIDADMQNDPADIPRLIEMLKDWDVVSGWRKDRRDTRWKRFSSRFANGVRNRLTHDNFHDSASTLKAYRREFLKRVKMFDGMHRFLPTLLRLEGARVTETVIHHRERPRGKTKYGTWRRLRRSLRDLFAVRWMQARHIDYDIEEEIG